MVNKHYFHEITPNFWVKKKQKSLFLIYLSVEHNIDGLSQMDICQSLL